MQTSFVELLKQLCMVICCKMLPYCTALEYRLHRHLSNYIHTIMHLHYCTFDSVFSLDVKRKLDIHHVDGIVLAA